MEVLGMVMAGGRGERLFPLTKDRAKPAVPFGGKYRIIDFVLSNFINSGISSIYVLTQFKAQSLVEHLQEGWQVPSVLRNQFVHFAICLGCSLERVVDCLQHIQIPVGDHVSARTGRRSKAIGAPLFQRIDAIGQKLAASASPSQGGAASGTSVIACTSRATP